MHTDQGRIILETDRFTESIIGCAFTVSNGLGSGFLEKVYENALVLELLEAGHEVKQQFSAPVFYPETKVGDYVADLVVDNRVLIELKAVKALDPIHEAQCYNYLNATEIDVCLLFNFGRPKIEIKRILRKSSSV
ncbi:MAG: GxxExxY protein [Planctomycetota bacterium]